MKIFTAQKRYRVQPGQTVVDVTVKSAQGAYRVLAPTWDMVMGYKNGSITQEQYTEQYYRIAAKSWLEHPHLWYEMMSSQTDIVFVCYCPAGSFCHRVLLANYLLKACLAHNIPASYDGELQT